MQSTDQKTLLTTLIFILNCIHKNKKRTEIMIASRTGVRVCINLLDSMVKLHDAEDQSDGAKAFDIGCDSISQFYAYINFKIVVDTPLSERLLKLVQHQISTVNSGCVYRIFVQNHRANL